MPVELSCYCLLYPYFNLGGGIHLYYAEAHAGCGESFPCNDPQPVSYAYYQNESPQYCDRDSGELGDCQNAGIGRAFASNIRLGDRMPKDLAADDPKITPGKTAPALHTEDIKFETPARNVDPCQSLCHENRPRPEHSVSRSGIRM